MHIKHDTRTHYDQIINDIDFLMQHITLPTPVSPIGKIRVTSQSHGLTDVAPNGLWEIYSSSESPGVDPVFGAIPAISTSLSSCKSIHITLPHFWEGRRLRVRLSDGWGCVY